MGDWSDETQRSSQLLTSLPWRTNCIISPNNFSDILVAPEYQPLVDKLGFGRLGNKIRWGLICYITGVGDKQVLASRNLDAAVSIERQGSSMATIPVTPKLFSILLDLRVIDVLAWIFPTGKCTTAVPHYRQCQQIGRKKVGCILPTIDLWILSYNLRYGPVWVTGLIFSNKWRLPLHLVQILHYYCPNVGGSSYLFPSKGASISAASAILVNMQLSALHLHHLLKVFSFIHSMPHSDFIFVIRAIGICLHISQTFCPHCSCCQSLHLSLALLFFDLKTFQACHTHQHLSREDFTLPHIFQVDSAGVQVIFRSPPGVQVLFFWLGAQPNWHA